MENDLVRIKEDAVKIQEADLLDTVKSIESENTKSSFVLVLASALIALISGFDNIPKAIGLAFFILASFSIIIALYNILAKKLSIHTNVDEIFVKNTPTKWEEHLTNKHLRLRNSYLEAKCLLYKKANLNRLSFVFVAISVILIAITNVIIIL